MHPERPDRVRAVMARLHAAELAGRCRRLPAREATLEEVGACHIPELMEAVDLLSEQSRLQGNAGLHFSPGGPGCRAQPLQGAGCAGVLTCLHRLGRGRGSSPACLACCAAHGQSPWNSFPTCSARRKQTVTPAPQQA